MFIYICPHISLDAVADRGFPSDGGKVGGFLSWALGNGLWCTLRTVVHWFSGSARRPTEEEDKIRESTGHITTDPSIHCPI